LAASLVDRIGRRLLFLTSAIGMLVFFSSQTACSATFAYNRNDAAARGVIVFIFLFFAAYESVSIPVPGGLMLLKELNSLAFTPLIVSYTLEILPFSLRAKGFMVFNAAVSTSLIFNQYVNPIALDKLRWKYNVRMFLCNS
jgi:MFS family permease